MVKDKNNFSIWFLNTLVGRLPHLLRPSVGFLASSDVALNTRRPWGNQACKGWQPTNTKYTQTLESVVQLLASFFPLLPFFFFLIFTDEDKVLVNKYLSVCPELTSVQISFSENGETLSCPSISTVRADPLMTCYELIRTRAAPRDINQRQALGRSLACFEGVSVAQWLTSCHLTSGKREGGEKGGKEGTLLGPLVINFNTAQGMMWCQERRQTGDIW